MDSGFYIYGAGIVATSIYTAIKKLYNYVPRAFLVSGKEGNPSEIEGIPVLTLSEMGQVDNSASYLIATPEIHHMAISDSLCQWGLKKERLIFVDNKLENRLMEAYFRSLQGFMSIFELLGEGDNAGAMPSIFNSLKWENARSDVEVFQAKCHVDKTLKMSLSTARYIQSIQVGASLTNEVITEIRDNIGENISHKNRNYCELTAAYYAWKNSQAQYKGLCHYRRIFDVTEKQISALLVEHEDVVVILPYPSIHYPNISGQHERYVSETDWNAMLLAMKEVAPEYYEAYVTDISKQRFFYNFNMLIAKREVFDDYCKFLFSVLERTEELTTPKGWERADRFAGYLGENLTTIYFMKNRDKLTIIHAGKNWLT